MASGILYVDKPAGLTSRALDNAVQKLFHTKKVGHLGTLDPFATGLLIVAVNQGTKSLAYLPDERNQASMCHQLPAGAKTEE
jgi:tRNA pseudouridine55 synthase